MNQLYRNRKKYSKTQLERNAWKMKQFIFIITVFWFYPISLTYNFKIDRGVKLNLL